ncbi:VRR-NUC domain-containing protein [Pseudomonas sp. ZM23]|uniref:phosphodiesterase I n=1 Tax=Pseudomonas triclosanedens TaxID=2961893 RepID=A0ABY6ZQN7_9PSED|nr:VRR-NUC domain-containing protein [Pseudomonas triclosanedens]MCP8466146.1 VRR-NUC domain-containing protein [Pseudomonas triclosanedens]MCP8472381.1 VRR-NUC domain-containing protein [Pseudomonas triclosanedens]MCP8477445.1 VRR-NUC domain-containing protein [Pseudomonas triclosanedens]WAI47222.1 VRR-NUC domain-containing protein [Pseudomonas triclosanedens]
MPAPLAPSLYYLSNFHRALDWIDERYADLLDAEEAAFIAGFRELPLPSQALLVRLAMRKGPHFRAGKLSYAEIGDISEAAAPLLELGWLSDSYPLALDELLPLLLKDELIARFHDDLPRASLKKAELYEHLHAYHDQVKTFAGWYPDLDRLYTLMATPLCDRLRLLFFGNLQQDWSEFVLADLGIFRYESVPFTADSRAFRCRDDLETYIHLWNGAVRFEAGEPIAELLAELGDLRTDNPYLQARHGRLLYRMAYQLEREGELDAALALYRRTAAEGSRQRQIRVLERLQRFDEAHALVLAALAAPESDGELQLVERARTRLVRQLGLPKDKPGKPTPPLRIDLELPRPDFNVEFAVQAVLHEDAAPVYYVENALICSLFGLLCWEVIFAPLPGAFFHPFQAGPSDLNRADFVTRRAEGFAARLALLDGNTYRAAIRDTYTAKSGILSPFVHWELLDENLLEQALQCLPAAHLKLWFERLLADPKANRAGMPDLIQFWPDEARYRMIEVKGPGDRLQDNQKRWLDFCAKHGMPVEVCYVRWQEEPA